MYLPSTPDDIPIIKVNEDDTYRLATREEFDLAVEWAAQEGWNPGLDDADIFWETDPEGFVCVERDGEVIATGSIVSYGTYGFMGFFIVKQGLRGKGIGRPFWHWRKERLLGRLRAGASIGMDGVFDIQPFYAKGGFVFSHRNLRMEGMGKSGPIDSGLGELTTLPFQIVQEYDQKCFGFDRETFLRAWIAPARGLGLGAFDGERLKGYGVVRQCRNGYKIGPLFADDEETAESLFSSLSNRAAGEALYLDVPENNEAALSLAKRHGMSEVFGCARMYFGESPKLPWQNIFGVTTFELG